MYLLQMKILLFLILPFLCLGQLTVGTIYHTEEALDGYTFFSPFSGTKAYLVDNCGRKINVWDRGTRPGLSAYFLDNGLMLRTYKTNPNGPFTSASNAGGLELVDWDNNTVWSYEFNTETFLSHHDAVYMPNGNILLLTWELIYFDELVELGRDPNEIAPEGFAWNEKIIEIETIGNDSINIVWEWKIKDHYIQDLDSTKSNFGVISEHPELFDINLAQLDSPNSHSDLDYNHFNAIDYNEELDQILISVRNSDEIWIIDHSTTIEEAATHTGGRYGKGGDILYRWGNASAYQRADISEEVLYGQHGSHWIKSGPDKGKILIYNNGNGRPGTDYSIIELLVPEQNIDGSYPVPESEPFGPLSAEWRYGDEQEDRFFSPYLSNAQRLPNGNTLVNAGSPGYVFEINDNKEIVWEYIIPLFGDTPANQGGFVNNNSTFRAYKFAKNFSGFDGIEISVGAPIENNPQLLESCLTSSTISNNLENHWDIIVNQSPNTIDIINNGNLDLTINLISISGHILFRGNITSNDLTQIDKPHMNGLYFLQFFDEAGKVFCKKIIIH